MMLTIQWISEVAVSAGTHLARQKSDQCQARPLPQAERPKKLLLGVAKSETDDISGRGWQGKTPWVLGFLPDRKYCEDGKRSINIVAGYLWPHCIGAAVVSFHSISAWPRRMNPATIRRIRRSD
jgi:hypothetical protein